jgi:hypothetical protein
VVVAGYQRVCATQSEYVNPLACWRLLFGLAVVWVFWCSWSPCRCLGCFMPTHLAPAAKFWRVCFRLAPTSEFDRPASTIHDRRPELLNFAVLTSQHNKVSPTLLLTILLLANKVQMGKRFFSPPSPSTPAIAAEGILNTTYASDVEPFSTATPNTRAWNKMEGLHDIVVYE